MQRFRNILYIHEASVEQRAAFARAVSLAVSNQAKLTVLGVIPSRVASAATGLAASGLADAVSRTDVACEYRQELETLVEACRASLDIHLEMRVGKPFLEAIHAVLSHDCDLVVKSAEDPSWVKKLFGSDDMHLLRKCPCPVWLMRPDEKPRYENIVAAVDFDPLSTDASDAELNRNLLDLASSLTLADSASLHVVHAWEADAETTLLSRAGASLTGIDEYLDKVQLLHRKGLYVLGEALRERLGDAAYQRLSPSFHLPKGPAKKVIAPLAVELQADLVVMGTVARSGISGLLIGNTAEAILDQLGCSVMAIKPTGFSSPVKLD